MNIYLDEKDMGKTVTVKTDEDGNQCLYISNEEKWKIKSLMEYKQKVIEETCARIASAIAYEVLIGVESNEITTEQMGNIVEKAIYKVRLNRY